MNDTVTTLEDELNARSLPDPATLSLETVLELQRLRRSLLDIQLQIRAIAGPVALVARTPVTCQKCGYSWTPYNPFVPPLRCAQCGCHTWNEPVTATSRKPSDPPARSFKVRKGKRRPKLRVWAEGSGSPFAPKLPMADGAAPVVSPPPFIPPSVRSALPPPPPLFTGSLSSHFAELRRDEGPEQPERAASHPPTMTESEITNAVHKIAENMNIYKVVAEDLGPDAAIELADKLAQEDEPSDE
jgi:predicted Zn-ribbon and HTH transcriptional regulator